MSVARPSSYLCSMEETLDFVANDGANPRPLGLGVVRVGPGLQTAEDLSVMWAETQALLFATVQDSRCIVHIEEAVRRWSRNNVTTQRGTK